MLSRAQAASLLGSVRPNRTEPERPGWATEQAEPSMQATEPSPSGGSARFARFDYRPAPVKAAQIVTSRKVKGPSSAELERQHLKFDGVLVGRPGCALFDFFHTLHGVVN